MTYGLEGRRSIQLSYGRLKKRDWVIGSRATESHLSATPCLPVSISLSQKHRGARI